MRLFKPNIQRLSKEKNVPALIRVLKDSSWDTVGGERIRVTAAEALAEIGDPQAVNALTDALRDPSDFVRLAATEALVRIGQPAVEQLIVALSLLLDDLGLHLTVTRDLDTRSYSHTMPPVFDHVNRGQHIQT